MQKISKNIISSCGHIGTHKYNWQPESERFAIGYRSSVLIYNIAMSNFYFNRACFFVENLIYKYGRIYVYGLEKKNDRKFIQKLENLNQVVTTHSWCGGFVTNARIFKGKIKNIKKKFSAILGLSYDYQNYSLPREAKIIKLPSVGVVDSNANAETFTYPIPMNSSNFGVTRLLAYTFTLKVFKGISKRILARFKKKIKIGKSKKLTKRSKRKCILRRYFKKLKRKLKIKKKKLKRKLKTWSKRYKKSYFRFKSRQITLTERKKRKDYIRKNGQDWLTIAAALKRYAEVERVRRLPKRKVKKFIQKRLLITKKKNNFKLPKTNDRKFQKAGWEKIFDDSKKKKVNSFIRIRKKLRQRRQKKNYSIKKKPKTKKATVIRRNKSKKYKYRYRPNKKWKFKPNRFKFKGYKKKIVSKFNKIKKKINKLSKLKNFKKIITKEKKFKNPKFIYRFLKKAISKYKLRKIYKFLYKKKKKIILRRKKNKKYSYGQKKQKGLQARNRYQGKQQIYSNRNYVNKNYYNNYNQNYRGAQKYKNHEPSKKNVSEKYRYYYKDYSYTKKPIKKKRFYY